MNTSTNGLIGIHDGGIKGNAHVPASALVYEDIRNRIISLALLPETTLVRAELADSFKVSQSPVREAIMRLEQDGLVVSYPQSRTVVTKIDEARIREEHFLRVAAECEVVRQLADIKESAAVTKAKGILKMQEALVGDIEQIDLFKQLDDRFGKIIVEEAGGVCRMVTGEDFVLQAGKGQILCGNADVVKDIARVLRTVPV